MSLLLRKIEKAKWMQNDIRGGEDVSADAITNCLKTTANALSVWEVGDESLVPDAALAMASQFDHLDTIDIVLLCQGALGKAGLEVKRSAATTALSEFAANHRDVVGLTYRKLGELARLIVDGIKGNRVRRYTKGKLLELLRGAVASGRISVDDLREGVRCKVR
ncbi:MAG TPA: hypothetical protein VMX15_03975 [Candidatus Heimdallarchaeota archaeon]|nr:hypothetical protein [Candidatus Heimdallarchaeota archaeon]